MGIGLGGILAGGMQGLRDATVKERAQEHEMNMELMRKQLDAEFEQRIHERNRGEQLSDAKARRAQELSDIQAEREFQLKKEGMKKDKPVYKILKSVDRNGMEVDKLVQVNPDGTYSEIKSKGGDADSMAKWEAAREAAKSLYDEKASVWKSDKSQFGMSEDEIIDTWANEILKYGAPRTGIAGVGKVASGGGGGMLNGSTTAIASEQKDTLPPQAASQLKEGKRTTFANGQVWTLQNGVPKRIR